jgi:hypothetical protein
MSCSGSFKVSLGFHVGFFCVSFRVSFTGSSGLLVGFHVGFQSVF